MAVLFADQIGFWENGKAEFEVRRIGEKPLEGTRVIATSEQHAKEVFLNNLKKQDWSEVLRREKLNQLAYKSIGRY